MAAVQPYQNGPGRPEPEISNAGNYEPDVEIEAGRRTSLRDLIRLLEIKYEQGTMQST